MIKTWIQACRIKTLPAAICPVCIGAFLAASDNLFHRMATLSALLGAIGLQIGCNIANDYFDYVKGADTPDRLGPKRVTQQGLVSIAGMKRAIIITFLSNFGAILIASANAWLGSRLGFNFSYFFII